MRGKSLRLVCTGKHSGSADDFCADYTEEYPMAGKDELRWLLGEVQAACRAGKYEAAEGLYRRVLTLDEQNSEAWYGLGMLFLQRGCLEDAYEYLSEYAVLAKDLERAEKVEVVLFFLERLMGGGDELPSEIQEELEEQFLASFSEQGWLDRPLVALEGLTPREVARTREGKIRVLVLMREMECFLQAVDRLAFGAPAGAARRS